MANVLGNHHQCRRQNGENRKPLKARGIEGWQGKPVGLRDRGSIDNAHREGERIARQHANQDRDNRHKATEQHGAKDRHAQRYQRDDNGFGIRRLTVGRQQACHVRRNTG
ncbi:hypothetical protein D3C76_1533850 [compost metagenome]